MLYKATKNIYFKSIDKDVLVDGVIELEPDYAEEVNENLKLTFPDVSAVLVPVSEIEDVAEDVADEHVEEKPRKKKPRKEKSDETPDETSDLAAE